MPFDFRTRSLRVNRIINSGSTSTSPLLIYGLGSATDTEGGFTTNHFTTGSDTWLFISGSSGTRGTSNRGVVTFKGDVVTSGSLYAVGGITGSLTKLAGGTDYLRAGSNVTLTTGSDGSVTIASTGGAGGSGNWNELSPSPRLNTTASVAIAGALGSSYAAQSAGSDVFFFVSGTFNDNTANAKKSVFRGDVRISGSLSQGVGTTTSGDGSHAEGDGTLASADYSHAEGLLSEALETYAHAEGHTTTASGFAAHSEGDDTTASGYAAHSEGYRSLASSDYAHAEGVETAAVALGSHAGGYRTIASGSYQTVYGKFNLRNNTDSLFVIGDGSGTSDSTRRDVLRVNSGSVQVTGSLIATSITGSITRLTNGGEYLKPGSNVTLTTGSDGSITIAASGGGGGSPAGSNTYLQFNADGSFGAVANLTFATSSNTLSLNGNVDTQIADTRWYLRNNSADALSFWDGSGGSRRFQLNMGDSNERLVAYDNAGFAAGDSSDLVILHDGTNSYIKNNTGALVISGANSLILTGSVYSLNNVTINGDLAVNGGDITSTESSTTIFSTGVSSIAIGGAASSISLGNSSNANGFTLNVAASRTGSISLNLATGATISGLTKNINIGQGGDPGSTTNIRLGTTDTAATTNIYVSGSSYVTGSVSIKGSIVPDANTTYTLGTDALRWAHVYTGDLHLRNERGDWTVIEEVDFLRIVNNKTGKNFRMMMQPIDD